MYPSSNNYIYFHIKDITQAKILTIHILDTHGSTAQKEKLLMRNLKVHRKDNLLHLESNKTVST
jgi:hypothetical protein